MLAAGESSRFGQPKQLLEWQGEALVRRAARIALEGGLSPVVVVTGAHAEQVRQALAGLEVSVVENPAWQEGQAASLRAGLSKLPASAGAAVFLLADQPLVTPALVRGLLAVHCSSLSAIVAPLIDGQRGNPVLFDRVTFPDLLTLQGDQGGRVLFSRYPVAWLPWHDTGPLRDVDTPADFRALLDEGRRKMISAIVLAAGQSRRMGQAKMLLPWGSTTVIGQVVQTLAQAGLDEGDRGYRRQPAGSGRCPARPASRDGLQPRLRCRGDALLAAGGAAGALAAGPGRA